MYEAMVSLQITADKERLKQNIDSEIWKINFKSHVFTVFILVEHFCRNMKSTSSLHFMVLDSKDNMTNYILILN